MNMTEAWETVLESATQHGNRTNAVRIDGEWRDLKKALHKVGPKIKRMRARLNKIREKKQQEKAIAKTMPAWLDKATR